MDQRAKIPQKSCKDMKIGVFVIKRILSRNGQTICERGHSFPEKNLEGAGGPAKKPRDGNPISCKNNGGMRDNAKTPRK